ncbi:hypothetical protein IscW_ISCW020435 [Ixodes scapularis]|uniref:Uncharacterized protein n=1 Tax=Ixodes scapularis TaxID=6945 RepID=B7PZX6_IXOSC|nr:hypothetical protein IscW_ISCW020435 [Ixodes scapularis]|eukprot:XP_002406479.1 hypothetical protein IscW_ISCW020435 [Ixodes scapularis]
MLCQENRHRPTTLQVTGRNYNQCLPMDDDECLGIMWSLQQQRTQFLLLEERIQAAETEADELEEKLMATNFTVAALLAEKWTTIPRERVVYVRSVEEAADKEYQCRICVNADEMKEMSETTRGELRKEREAQERMEVEMKEAREGLRDEKGETKGVNGGELSGQRKETHVQCGDCKKSVDIDDTRFDSVEEAGMTEFMCRMCVLNAQQDRLEAENKEPMARIVMLEAELERERRERHTVDDKLAKANEKLADLEVVLLPSDITANDKVVDRDGGRTYKEAL